MRTRTIVVSVLALTAVTAAGLPLRSHSLPPAAASNLRWLCGNERWTVKTFSDADRSKVSLTRRYRTIKQLNQLTRPAHRPANGRVAGELSVYRVIGTVTAAINEDDGDIHLALMGDDGSTMIAEAPEPACSLHSRDRSAMVKARLAAQDIHVADKVVAVGVGFFDFSHHQTGHAKNQIELHPLLFVKKQ